MTDQKHIPEKLGPFSIKGQIEAGWGWTLHKAEQTLDGGKTRTVRLRIFYNQPKDGQLHKRLSEARDIFGKHTHLHLQRIFAVEHFTLEEDRSSVLAVAEEKIEPWTPPRESDYRTLMGQLLGAVEHMASVKLPGAGLSSKNLGRTVKGNAVICNLSAVWEQHWSGRSRAGDADYYRTLPPEMAEQPAEFEAPQWVWSAGVLLLDAVASMTASDATIADDIDVFDSAVSEYLSHKHTDYFEPKIKDLPGDLQDILKKCLAGKVEDRYPSLQFLRAAVEYPIQTLKSGERYAMPSSYRVGDVTHPSKKTAAQAYTIGFVIFAAAVAVILLFVLLRPLEDETASLSSPTVDEQTDPDLVALRQKLESESPDPETAMQEEMELPEPLPQTETVPVDSTVITENDIPEEVDQPVDSLIPEDQTQDVLEGAPETTLAEEKEAVPEPTVNEVIDEELLAIKSEEPVLEPEPEPLPSVLSVFNQTGEDVFLLSSEGGISNQLSAGSSFEVIWSLTEVTGTLKAIGPQPWIFSVYTVDFAETNSVELKIDSLVTHKAQIVIRGDNEYPELNITYSEPGDEEEQPLPENYELIPGTYLFRLHRPDYLTMRMKVKFPYAPGMFAFSVPSAERWVPASSLKKLMDWMDRAQTEPDAVLKEMQASKTLKFESEKNRQRYDDLRKSLESPVAFETVTLNLLSHEEITTPVTLVLSTDEDSTKTLTPGHSVDLPPGEYLAQYRRPDYLPLQTTLSVSGKTAQQEIQVPAEGQWEKTQNLLDLIALEKAYKEKKDTRTIIFLMQGLKNVEFEYPEHQQRFVRLRKQYYE